MPRLKKDTNDFHWRLLTILDINRLQDEAMPEKFPVASRIRNRERLRSLEDFRSAYWANEHDLNRPRNSRNGLGHEPGRRSWTFWVFGCGLNRVPVDQLLELDRRRLVTAKERRQCIEFADIYKAELYPKNFTLKERALINSWRPTGQPAKIKKFPTENED